MATIRELRKTASKLGIKRYSRYTKAQLEEVISTFTSQTEPITPEIVIPHDDTCRYSFSQNNAALVPYADTFSLRCLLRFISVYIRLWLASHIRSNKSPVITPFDETKHFIPGYVYHAFFHGIMADYTVTERTAVSVTFLDEVHQKTLTFPIRHEIRHSAFLYEYVFDKASGDDCMAPMGRKIPKYKPRKPRIRFEVGKTYTASRFHGTETQQLTVLHRYAEEKEQQRLFVRLAGYNCEAKCGYIEGLITCSIRNGVEIFERGLRPEDFIFRADQNFYDITTTAFTEDFVRADHDKRREILKAFDWETLRSFAQQELFSPSGSAKFVKYDFAIDFLNVIEQRFALIDVGENVLDVHGKIIRTPLTECRKELYSVPNEEISQNISTWKADALIDYKNLHGQERKNAREHNITVLSSFSMFPETLTGLLLSVSVDTIKTLGKHLGCLHNHSKGNKRQLAEQFARRYIEIREMRSKAKSLKQQHSPAKQAMTSSSEHNNLEGIRIFTNTKRQICFAFD